MKQINHFWRLFLHNMALGSILPSTVDVSSIWRPAIFIQLAAEMFVHHRSLFGLPSKITGFQVPILQVSQIQPPTVPS